MMFRTLGEMSATLENVGETVVRNEQTLKAERLEVQAARALILDSGSDGS